MRYNYSDHSGSRKATAFFVSKTRLFVVKWADLAESTLKRIKTDITEKCPAMPESRYELTQY